MRLPISLPKEVTFFFTYAFPYTVLSQANESESLLLSSYLEPYMLSYNTGHLEVGYLDGFSYGEPDRLPQDVFIKKYINATSHEEEFTIERISNQLSNGFYMVAFADEYYIPCRKAYSRTHYVHEFLIYGIDDNNIKTLAINEKGLLGFPDFPRTALMNAIDQGRKLCSHRIDCPWIGEQYLICLKPNEGHFQNRVDPSKIADKIEAYFHAIEDKCEMERLFASREIKKKTEIRGNPQIALGINLPHAMRIHFQRQKERIQENMPVLFEESYQRIHMFAEQYAVALRRARAVETYVNMEKEIAYLERARRAAELIRLHYLRCVFANESTKVQCRLVEHMLDILSGI